MPALQRYTSGGAIRIVGRVVTWGLVTTLIGCATAPRDRLDETAWRARQITLNSLTAWTVTGRLGITQAQEGWHASVVWYQQGDDYLIQFVGPLGQGRLQVRGDLHAVQVQTASGQYLVSDNPDEVLEQAAGVRLPIGGLRYWIRGLPDPKHPSVLQGDAEGRLTRLEQLGWVILYPRYAAVEWPQMASSPLELPIQITATRDDIQVRIVIQQWEVQATTTLAEQAYWLQTDVQVGVRSH